MNPDRRAGIEPLPETVANPPRIGHLPRWARVPASILIFVGAGTLDQMTNRAEAADSECRVGIGLQVEPEFYAKGARISVIESGSTRLKEPLDPTKERLIDLGVAPSNTTRDGKAARVVVHFAANQQGRQLIPRKEVEVNCGQFEHVKYILKGGVTPVAPAATPAATLTPLPISSATPSPDRVATLEAEIRGVRATATRAAENEQLTQKVRTAVATEARATIEAERRATETVVALIGAAEQRGAAQAIATVQAITATAPAQAGERQRTRGESAPDIETILQSNIGWLLGGITVVAAALGGILVWRRRHPVVAAPAGGGGGPGPGGPAGVP